jgi:hypothetical protein
MSKTLNLWNLIFFIFFSSFWFLYSTCILAIIVLLFILICNIERKMSVLLLELEFHSLLLLPPYCFSFSSSSFFYIFSINGARLNLQNCEGNSLHLQPREVEVPAKVLMLLKVGMQELVSWASLQLASLLCWINWLGHFQRYRKYSNSLALSSSIILSANL